MECIIYRASENRSAVPANPTPEQQKMAEERAKFNKDYEQCLEANLPLDSYTRQLHENY